MPKMGILITPLNNSFFLVSEERGVSGIYESIVPPFGDTVRFFIKQVKQTNPRINLVTNFRANILKKDGLGVGDLWGAVKLSDNV